MRWLKIGIVSSAAFLGLIAGATPAQAQEGPTGFELGFRVGYALPMGKAIDDSSGGDGDMTEVISGQIPLQLDIGGRVTPNLMVGGYFSYGFGFLADDLGDSCDDRDLDCSAHSMRLGAQLQYHFAPGQDLDPWLGAGVGYEWLSFVLSDSDTDATTTFKGWEFLNVSGGLDFPAGMAGSVGPFVSLSMGQYDEVSLSCSGDCGAADDDESEDIDEKAMHQWLTLGFRGTFVM